MNQADLYAQIQALLEVRRWDDAIAAARAALAGQPQDPRLHCFLAFAYYRAERTKESLAAAESAIRADPEFAWAHRLRAQALARLERHREALPSAVEASRLEPGSREALATLAQMQMRLRQTKAAEMTVESLLRTAPDWPESFNIHGMLMLAKRKYNLAENDFRQALRLEPDSALYINNLAVAMQRLGRHKEAIDAMRIAAATDPSLKLVQRNLASTARWYIWGLPLVAIVVAVIAIATQNHSAPQPGAAHTMQPTIWPLIAFMVFLSAVVVGLYWWRRRELHPVVTRFYEFDLRQTLRRPSRSLLAKAAVELVLLAIFISALLANQTILAGLAAVSAYLWVIWSAIIVRFARRVLRLE